MQVVAKQQGLYGTVRERGDLFEVESEKAVSKRWMALASSDEGKAILREAGKTGTGVSEDEIAAEVAAASGKAGALYKAENAKLTARVKELEAELASLKADKAKPAAAEKPAKAEEEAEEADAEAEEEAEKIKQPDEEPEEAPPARISRRSRS